MSQHQLLSLGWLLVIGGKDGAHLDPQILMPLSHPPICPFCSGTRQRVSVTAGVAAVVCMHCNAQGPVALGASDECISNSVLCNAAQQWIRRPYHPPKSDAELRPCPHCGAAEGLNMRNDLDGRSAVVCARCGCRGPAFDRPEGSFSFGTGCLVSWNNRSADDHEHGFDDHTGDDDA